MSNKVSIVKRILFLPFFLILLVAIAIIGIVTGGSLDDSED